MLKVGHVLYKVQNLRQAVGKLERAGFTVQYGSDPLKSHNAIIWFDQGIFIEIYEHSGLSAWSRFLMNIVGYGSMLRRISGWEDIGNGWCDWCLESAATNLTQERQMLKRLSIEFKFHRASRVEATGRKIFWDLIMPKDTGLPLIMSSYMPDPRPKSTVHANGATAVKYVVVGTELLYSLLNQTDLLKISTGSGIKMVKLLGFDTDLIDILK